jgi:RND family efflux transporter MFP subunit
MIARLLPVVLLAAGALAACSPPETAAEPAPRIARIETVQAGTDSARREFVGRVEARLTVDLAFQVGGRLADFPVTEGQSVARGQTIARLEQQDFDRAVREARVQLQQAETSLQRQSTLHERGIASDAALEDAQTQHDLRAVALETARQNLAYATIEAPFDGLVSRRLVDNFTTVGAGQPVARIQDLSERRVAIPVPENLIGALDGDDGYSAVARFPFLPGQSFPLEYREIVAEAEQGSQTYRVIFALPDDVPGNILPGMTANVSVQLDRNGETIPAGVRAPVSALAGSAGGGFHVWVFDEASGEVSARTVSIGPIAGDTVMVEAGLRPGERIVTAGVNALHEGMKVRPMAPRGGVAAAEPSRF